MIMENTYKKPVRIECPECHEIQAAEVEYLYNFWDIYYHQCIKCGYIILESEWNEVEDSGLELIKY